MDNIKNAPRLFLDGSEANDFFLRLRDSKELSQCKNGYEEMWEKVHQYLDHDFPKQLKQNPDSRLWELYLSFYLFSNNIRLEQRPTGSPDILAVVSGKRVWIEAVVPTLGEGDDKVLTHEERGGGGKIPEKQIIMRLTNAIKAKHIQVTEFKRKNPIFMNDKYIIAICGTLITREYMYSSVEKYLFRCLYGIGPTYFTFGREKGDVQGPFGSRRVSVKKQSDRKVSTDLFLSNDYRDISGILYSGRNYYDYNGNFRDFIFFHNPNASKPLEMNLLGLGSEYSWDIHNNQPIWNKVGHEIELV